MKNITNKSNNWKTKVEIALLSVRQKYGIFGKFTIENFHAVREGEGIEMLAPKFHAQMKNLPGIQGAILGDGKGRRLIYLRKLDDVATAMHELGHYFLKHKGVNELYLLKASDSFGLNQEREADYFAELAKMEGKNQ